MSVGDDTGRRTPDRCSRSLGGTGFQPVLVGYQPASRGFLQRTERCFACRDESRRQVAAGHGQVGRATQTDSMVPAEEWASLLLKQHSWDYPQTPRDDTRQHPHHVPRGVASVSPAIVAEIEEERRLTESGTRRLFEWRLREIHGLQDPVTFLDSLSGIRIGPAGPGDFSLPIP